MKQEARRIMRLHIPLTLAFALLVQGATVVWWAAGHERDDAFHERRITALESGLSRADDTEGKMLERLARIEEREDAQLRTLDRIEKRLGGQ